MALDNKEGKTGEYTTSIIYFIIEELTILCSTRASITEHVELRAIEEEKVQRGRWRRRKFDGDVSSDNGAE